jgi:hypothetical protein
MLTVGEVHTGLIQNATALPQARCERVLNLVEGETVLFSQRPTSYAVSPNLRTGVDCWLPSASGRQVRGVGAVVSHAIITGGRVVQVSSCAAIEGDTANRRLLWSHYLSRPGRLAAIGKVDWPDMALGFLRGSSPNSLNVGAITARVMDRVQTSGELDRRPPFRSQRTRLRWTVMVDEACSAAGSVAFTVESDTSRTVELTVGPEDAAAAMALCEDLALHDWLLTTLSAQLEATISSPRSAAEKSTRLRPVVEHLLHLWMPGARVAPSMLPVWDEIERRPGFTRQWNASVNWMRDQVAAGTIALLEVCSRRLSRSASG